MQLKTPNLSKYQYKLISCLSIFIMAMLLTGCHAKRKAITQKPAYVHPEDRLMQVIESWIGTPYRYGGESRDGTDCSGFVKAVYSEVYGIALPRTTKAMLEACRGISPDQLKPGDLVFFEISRNNFHVGIYTGDRRFAHASEKKGVIVSSLDEPYYVRTFTKAGRFF
jgi:cell wall-associated NlpC family hydrolase